MDVRELWTELLRQGVRVWLDGESKLRVDAAASPEMKLLVREHKSTVTAILHAQDLLNDSGLRLVRVVGGYALAKRPGALTPELRAALQLLDMDTLPLVHNNDGRRWQGQDGRH